MESAHPCRAAIRWYIHAGALATQLEHDGWASTAESFSRSPAVGCSLRTVPGFQPPVVGSCLRHRTSDRAPGAADRAHSPAPLRRFCLLTLRTAHGWLSCHVSADPWPETHQPDLALAPASESASAELLPRSAVSTGPLTVARHADASIQSRPFVLSERRIHTPSCFGPRQPAHAGHVPPCSPAQCHTPVGTVFRLAPAPCGRT